MANTALNRSSVQVLINKSGANLNQGDVVVLLTGTASAFVTVTGSVGYNATLPGVILEPNGIINNSQGLVAFGGYVPKINLENTANPGERIRIGGTGGKGTATGTVQNGDFAEALSQSTTPEAILFGVSLPNTNINDYILLEDRKPSGTAGGTFTSGAWRIRDLNTIVSDTGNNVVSLTGNSFALKAGIYFFEAFAPAVIVDAHSARLFNITDGIIHRAGQSNNFVYSVSGYGAGYAMIRGIINITTQKTFRIEHRCLTTQATNGLGNSSGAYFGVEYEIYTTITLHRIG